MGRVTMDPGHVWRWAYAAEGTTGDLHDVKKKIGTAADDMTPNLSGLHAHGAIREFEETWSKVAKHLAHAAQGTADKFTVSADAVSMADHQSVVRVNQSGVRVVRVELPDTGDNWAEGSR